MCRHVHTVWTSYGDIYIVGTGVQLKRVNTDYIYIIDLYMNSLIIIGVSSVPLASRY